MKTLTTTAVSTQGGKQYAHVAYLRKSRFSEENVVCIDGTQGQWCVEDFLRRTGPLSIDLGQGWVLVNADEIRAELRGLGVLS